MPAVLYALWIWLMVTAYMLFMGGWRNLLDFLDEMKERREEKRNRKR